MGFGFLIAVPLPRGFAIGLGNTCVSSKLASLTVTAAADALQVSRPALSSLLNGKAALSSEMAL